MLVVTAGMYVEIHRHGQSCSTMDRARLDRSVFLGVFPSKLLNPVNDILECLLVLRCWLRSASLDLLTIAPLNVKGGES